MIDKPMKPMRSVSLTAEQPLKFPVYISPKLDGIRVVKHKGSTLTKSLKHLPNRHIAAWVAKHLFDGADGEVISGDPQDETVYASTFSAAMTIEGRPEFKIYLFDLHNEPTLYATERYAKLASLIEALTEEEKQHVVLVPKTIVHNLEQFKVVHDAFLELGYEGSITQKLDDFYLHGKSSPIRQTQCKFKPVEDFEVEILGSYEAMHNGNAAFTNEVGATARTTNAENLTGKGELGGFHARRLDTGVEFKLAPGKLTREERVRLWEEELASPGVHNGRIAKALAMGYGSMTNGRPRHGRFVGWRHVDDLSLPD